MLRHNLAKVEHVYVTSLNKSSLLGFFSDFSLKLTNVNFPLETEICFCSFEKK